MWEHILKVSGQYLYFRSYKDFRNNVVVMGVVVGGVVVEGVVVGGVVVGDVAVVGVGAYPESFRSVSLFSVEL